MRSRFRSGLLILGHIFGSYDLDRVLASREAIVTHDLYVPALVLVLLGALTKSEQFPFHFWLPHAMAAPTPVSAYLHSAAMVKLGVFLVPRARDPRDGRSARGGAGTACAAGARQGGRRPLVALQLTWLVLVDVVGSNVAVAAIVLHPRTRGRRTGFVEIP